MTQRWEWLTLRDVLTLQASRRVLQQGWSPRCHAHPAEDGQWGVLKTTAIQAGSFDPRHNKELPEHLNPRPQIEVRAGDLLMTCAGPRARCGVPTLVHHTPGRLMISGKMYRFRPDGRIYPRFLEFWLLSPRAQQQIDAMKTGISDSGLNLTHERFVQLPVPAPSLGDQRRIVDILEEHLSRVDAAKASLLSAAARVQALQRSALNVHFGTSDGVVPIPLGELVQDITAGKSFGSSNAPAGSGEWGIIKVSAMTWGQFDPDQNKAVPANRVDPRFEIHPGDLLVSRANTSEYVGASVLVGRARPRLLLSDKSLRVSPRAGIRADWLWRALQAPTARRQLSALATGTKDSMRNISQGSLRRVLLPKVGPVDQAEAVARFDEVRAKVALLTHQLQRQERRAAALRQSLLEAAFSDRLSDRESVMSDAEEMITA